MASLVLGASPRDALRTPERPLGFAGGVPSTPSTVTPLACVLPDLGLGLDSPSEMGPNPFEGGGGGAERENFPPFEGATAPLQQQQQQQHHHLAVMPAAASASPARAPAAAAAARGGGSAARHLSFATPPRHPGVALALRVTQQLQQSREAAVAGHAASPPRARRGPVFDERAGFGLSPILPARDGADACSLQGSPEMSAMGSDGDSLCSPPHTPLSLSCDVSARGGGGTPGRSSGAATAAAGGGGGGAAGASRDRGGSSSRGGGDDDVTLRPFSLPASMDADDFVVSRGPREAGAGAAGGSTTVATAAGATVAAPTPLASLLTADRGQYSSGDSKSGRAVAAAAAALDAASASVDSASCDGGGARSRSRGGGSAAASVTRPVTATAAAGASASSFMYSSVDSGSGRRDTIASGYDASGAGGAATGGGELLCTPPRRSAGGSVRLPPPLAGHNARADAWRSAPRRELISHAAHPPSVSCILSPPTLASALREARAFGVCNVDAQFDYALSASRTLCARGGSASGSTCAYSWCTGLGSALAAGHARATLVVRDTSCGCSAAADGAAARSPEAHARRSASFVAATPARRRAGVTSPSSAGGAVVAGGSSWRDGPGFAAARFARYVPSQY